MMYHLKKNKKTHTNKQTKAKKKTVTAVVRRPVMFHPALMLANVSAGEKNSSLPLSLSYLTVVSQEYKQVHLNILFTRLSVGEKKKWNRRHLYATVFLKNKQTNNQKTYPTGEMPGVLETKNS